MLAVQSKSGAAGGADSRPLPLENGEFMHSREFLRRYHTMPQIKKAELVEGVVYMGSPVSTSHAIPDGIIHGWLALYAAHHPGTQYMPNATVILDAENTVQPDALLRRLPEQGGATRVNEEGYLAGPPELIVEIAATSASIDLRDKRRAYCRNGVKEYLVWCVADERVEWFGLEDDEYRPQSPDAHGLLHSRVFPGLRLPVASLLACDTAKVLSVLSEGAAPP
jgi:Uma2 family endonuclease